MVRFLLAIAATVGAFSLGPAPVAVAESASAPAPSAAHVDAPSTTWSASNSCYYPNCTAAHNAGEGNIPSSSDHYCSKQDRDGDGIACEW
jgi:Excalibur calcium-binding domain